MLFAQKRRVGRGSQLELTFIHDKPRNLTGPMAKAGCYICRIIGKELDNRKLSPEQLNGNLIASLRSAKRRPGVYELWFQLGNKDQVASFVLWQNGELVLRVGTEKLTAQRQHCKPNPATEAYQYLHG